MRILAVDVGTGTQDILLFDSEKEIENCIKMVMPSPTVLVAQAIRRATAQGEDLLLSGVTMGGGPCAWAARDHLEAGFNVYATPAAARTFDDDLARVEEMGVRVISEDEAEDLAHLRRIEMRDFYYHAIAQALAAFQVDLEVDALAVAVFDHGHAPPGVSDRLFRFEYLAERLREGHGLAGFAFWGDEIPPRLTRLQAVADTVDEPLPLLVMDTGPAAVLGALEDPQVRVHDPCIVVNLGNFHTLAFHLAEGRVVGLFEHHTGELTMEELERYLLKLAQGTITQQEVFDDMGHGALVLSRPTEEPSFFALTGPRRRLMVGSSLPIYQAVPHGDMMLAGCFGLIRAFAIKAPEHAAEIEAALGKA
jgi:uncharacterized protein (DUF1786 family)